MGKMSKDDRLTLVRSHYPFLAQAKKAAGSDIELARILEDTKEREAGKTRGPPEKP